MTRAALLSSMEQHIGAQCSRVLAEAREQAKAILAGADREANQNRAKALEDLAAEEAALAAENRHRAEAQIRLERLATRQHIADDVLTTARAKLGSLVETPDFEPVLDALLAEAVEALAAEEAAANPILVRVPKAHSERCRRWLETHGASRMTVEPAPALEDGVELVCPGAGFRIANTLGLRFERMRGALRKACVENLFHDDGETRP